MSTERDIALVDELLGQGEAGCVEFKRDNTNPQVIGEYISALANAAIEREVSCAYLLWGVDDNERKVVGSAFDPSQARQGNQPLEIWLSTRLKPSVAFSFRQIAHPRGRVVLLEIPVLADRPVEFEKTAYIPPRSRNERLASLMRRMNLCEEEGTGIDKIVTEAEIYQLPPPDFRSFGDLSPATMAVLFAPRDFAQMTVEERVRACYQHASLRWVVGDTIKNRTLRERFGIDPANSAQISSVIRMAKDRNLIKSADPARPQAAYIPYWA